MSVKAILNSFTNILASYIIPLLMALCVAAFLWGVVRFIAASGNPEERGKAKNFIIWGLIGLTVMVAFYGIVLILLRSFLGASGPPGPPGDWPFQVY